MCALAFAAGCHAIDFYTPSLQQPVPPELQIPRELSMISLPLYRIEPPDVLLVDVMSLVPRPSYRIGPLDMLDINVLGTLRGRPIHGHYKVETDGTMDLGMPYGVVYVVGLTVEQAEAEIIRSLQLILKSPIVSLSLVASATGEELSDRYHVAPDGTINLRRCGLVYVTGKTVVEAQKAIEALLAQSFDSPQVSVKVERYNSKSYYVVSESLTKGESMWRFPVTGNETVLDAMSRVPGSKNASVKTIFLVRPAPGDGSSEQVFPVDWNAVTRGAKTDTNYQLMPGDRVYIVDDSLVVMNTVLGRFADPINRLLSIGSLGGTTVHSAETLGREYNRRRRS
jgi:polysaccharide biosynthesis/export protein